MKQQKVKSPFDKLVEDSGRTKVKTHETLNSIRERNINKLEIYSSVARRGIQVTNELTVNAFK